MEIRVFIFHEADENSLLIETQLGGVEKVTVALLWKCYLLSILHSHF